MLYRCDGGDVLVFSVFSSFLALRFSSGLDRLDVGLKGINGDVGSSFSEAVGFGAATIVTGVGTGSCWESRVWREGGTSGVWLSRADGHLDWSWNELGSEGRRGLEETLRFFSPLFRRTS